MSLSTDLAKQFAKATNDSKDQVKPEVTHNGTIVRYNGKDYVQLDGSEVLTPISKTAAVKPDERVTVVIKNHTATVTGNISSPAARTGDVADVDKKVTELYSVVADKATIGELEAQVARIDTLTADNVAVKEKLTAAEADIDTLQADNATITGKLTAAEADIDHLESTKIDAKVVETNYALIKDLDATNANVNNLSATYAEFKQSTVDKLTANEASIKDLETNKLSAEQADLKYANLDFSNINQAAVEKLFTDSGIIKDLIVSEGKITGELVGVTIKGDLIEGGTVKADKLVVKGQNGLYYKLNTDGVTTEAEQTEYNSLDGSVITAKSITATKIAVDDLVAFGATIGGFNITTSSIYSGVKASADNTTRGIYLDKDGQISIGDADNYLKYYLDTDGKYKLAISAKAIKISTTDVSIETAIKDITEDMNTIKSEAIVSTQEQFYQSTSHEKPENGYWSTTQPTWTDGTYLWQRTLVTYASGDTAYTPSLIGVCITGNTGSAGSPGNGIASMETQFYKSSSNVEVKDGSWVSVCPPWEDGKYIWTRYIVTYENGATEQTYPMCVTGPKGATGETGPQGNTGTSVLRTTRYYMLVDASATKPPVPTTNPPTGWTTTEPAFTAGNTSKLYFCDQVVYSNNTLKYSDVSLSSSYEAAKAAYNKAVDASNTAQDAKDSIDNLEIGGRNLALDTNSASTVNNWTWTMQVGDYTRSNVVDNDVDCTKLLRGDTEQSGWSYIFYSSISAALYEPSTDYTVSFDVFPSVDVTFNIGLTEGDATDPLTSPKYATANTASANKWTKVQVTLTTLETLPESRDQGLYLNTPPSDVGVSYIFKNLKIEKGNKATDWTPAPEDMLTEEDANVIYTTRSEFNQSNNEISLTIERESTRSQEAEKQLQDSLSATNENLDNLDSTVNDINLKNSELYQMLITDQGWSAVNKKLGDVDGQIGEITSGIFFSTDESGRPSLTLDPSKNSASENKKTLVLTNEDIAFKSGNTTVAKITNDTMDIYKADVDNLALGDTWSFAKRLNGHLTLKYTGPANLIKNSSGNNGVKYWNTEGNTTIAATGTSLDWNTMCLQIVTTSSASPGTGPRIYHAIVSDDSINGFTHEAGKQYSLSFYGCTSAAAKIYVETYGAANSIATFDAAARWQKYEVTYTAPISGSLTFRLSIVGKLWLCNIMLVEGPNVAPEWVYS